MFVHFTFVSPITELIYSKQLISLFNIVPSFLKIEKGINASVLDMLVLISFYSRVIKIF